MPRTAAPLHILAVTDSSSRLEHVTEQTVSSVAAARRLARSMGYRVCTAGGLCYLDTAAAEPCWVITVHED